VRQRKIIKKPIIFWDAHRQLLTELGGYLPKGKTPFLRILTDKGWEVPRNQAALNFYLE
jgi:hypothetical protein